MIDWDDPKTPTPSIREYQELEKEDPNLFWSIGSGHHQNLLDEAISTIADMRGVLIDFVTWAQYKFDGSSDDHLHRSVSEAISLINSTGAPDPRL